MTTTTKGRRRANAGTASRLPNIETNGHTFDKTSENRIVIETPKFAIAGFKILGTAPLVQHRFSSRKRQMIVAAQEAGSQARSKKKREARNLAQDFEEAAHRSKQGWYGIPCAAFRNARLRAGSCHAVRIALASSGSSSEIRSARAESFCSMRCMRASYFSSSFFCCMSRRNRPTFSMNSVRMDAISGGSFSLTDLFSHHARGV